MHFKVFRDLEFGLGTWRLREDLLEVKPDVKVGLSAPHSIKSMPSDAHPVSDHPKPVAETPPPVKRVSMTAEDQALLFLRSPQPDSEEDDGGKDEDEKKVRDRESSKVAEILHQMSQASSTRQVEEISARQYPAKRSVPISFHDSASENAEASGSSAKRVRWSTESLSARGVPLPPMPSTAAQQAANKHFVRMMGRGRTPGSSSARSTGRQQDISVHKPMADLQPYDVVLGGALVAHFNLGNRRFMVLAFPHLEAFHYAPRRQRDEIVSLLMGLIHDAGGRFLSMKATCGVFEDLNDVQVPLHIHNVLEKLSLLSLDGKGVVRMFHLDCADVWVDKREDHKMPEHSTTAKRDPHLLPEDFAPGEYDIICCRRFGAREHVGNLWFAQMIESKSARYVASKGKMAKGVLVTEVLDAVRHRAGIGGFVKKNINDECWLEIGDLMAREKISQVRVHVVWSRIVKYACWQGSTS